ncbi:uncharacterized protein LOC126685397 [Mercurialis annua]|uniref:uncharacterized protein LOC126685397 n=1 Tax=Mercurialis annua TaxID=3986 RepID=UPI00215F01C8|nr:uncharacterized protein LOC126685397 [Mercurialis annua]XP_050235516.1 uncharacterized protein LOC126685397 [Mercurialis annua]XP_050235517.1 uncharacterized protein LOC126685397 [Mercurialis annua]
MDPHSQGNSSASPADPPLKRKRGRPRKDESQVQGETTPATPAADILKKNKQSADTTDYVGDEMVGKRVSGVIEGSFDAGYLLKVKVGDTETQLRGVVFLPGRFTPVTASNDVAPEVKMYKRTEMQIPAPIPTTQVHGPVPSLDQSDKQPIVQVKGLSSELQSAIPSLQENQPSSNILPVADNFPPLSSAGSSLVGAPQKLVESVTGVLPASIMPRIVHEKVPERNDLLKEFEDSLNKFHSVSVETTEQSKAMPQSVPPVDSIPGSGTVNVELEIQHQVANNDFKPNLENNHISVISESVESIETKVWTVKPVELPEVAAKTVSGNDMSHLNGRSVSNDYNTTQADSKSTPSTGLPVTLSEREAITSESKLATEGSSASSPVAGLPVTLFQREAVPSECKLAIDGPVLGRITEPQFCISPGVTVSNNVDCNLKDSIPPTES